MRLPPSWALPPTFLLTLTLTLTLALAATGCGDGEEGTTATEQAATAAPTKPEKTAPPRPEPKPTATAPGPANEPAPGPPASAFQPKPHRDSGGGAAQFTVKGADNSVQEFGAEAEPSELEAAATALHAFLDARAERNWAAACTYLSAETKRGFAQLASGSQPTSCATTLAALSGKVPAATLREAAIANVGSLRREGGQAFLIYRGADEVVYAIPASREVGAWKVASLAGTPLS